MTAEIPEVAPIGGGTLPSGKAASQLAVDHVKAGHKNITTLMSQRCPLCHEGIGRLTEVQD